MSESKTHKDLDAWKKAMELAQDVYLCTKRLPDDERFGLTSQLRRAAVSVPSNIAEGAARGSSVEFVRFLHIALGSLAELETQLLLVRSIGLCKDIDDTMDLLETERRLLLGLIRHMKKRIEHPSPITHHSSH